MSCKVTKGAVDSSKGSCAGRLNVAGKPSTAKSKVIACPDKDVHELANDLVIATTITSNEKLELGWGRWEIFTEVNFKLVISAKGSVNCLEG